LIAKQKLTVSGLEIAADVFMRLDESCVLEPDCQEGQNVRRGTVLAHIRGPLRALLSGERVALNFLRHLSGIATLTRRYVKELKGTRCTLLDTRKTTPGLRTLEKAAVRAGGGTNHRMGLFDGAMIKDNHIAAAGSITAAVAAVRKRIPPTIKIEVEASSLKQVREAARAGVDIIMLDNMPPGKMKKAVQLVRGRSRCEASGNLELGNLRQAALAGVDFVSVGAITHSAPNADISMKLVNA